MATARGSGVAGQDPQQTGPNNDNAAGPPARRRTKRDLTPPQGGVSFLRGDVSLFLRFFGKRETSPLKVATGWLADQAYELVFATQTLHQPAALTSLFGKILQGPAAAPALPVYWMQFAQFWPAL